MGETFAESLKSLRAARGLSQQQLAAKLFVDRSTIARWELGDRVPDLAIVPRIAECLGVETAALLDVVKTDEMPRVIVVDDERVALAGAIPVLEEVLPQASITGFTRPSDALAYARAHPVAIAFLDIEMGRSSGLDLCHELLEASPRTNVVFLTDYLRANFASVASEGDVPFRKELEHTRAYLAVESARLEDSLVVDIDCPHMAFRLPPLTLQPLVENTVKHGADPELPPLHVCVATREEPGFSVVTVEDTGPGFDEALLDEIMSGVDAGDPMDLDHIKGWSTNPATALANIRERLAACGASLDITPRQGGGTIATIRVPSDEFER